MFGLDKFYKKLFGDDKRVFLVELFYIGRFSPTRYMPVWLFFGLLFFSFGFFGLFFLVFLVVFSWWILYYLVFITFLYKWKKKHLNSMK